MTETTEAARWADKLRIQIAQNLREIANLYLDLHAEAANHHDAKDMPGGTAMVLLGPSADPEAWGYAQMSAALGRTHGHGFDELESDPAPPLLVLAGWVDIIRTERNQPTDLPATISREVDYLRQSIEWCLSTDADGDAVFLAVDELAADLRKVRAQLENVLHDGVRQDTGVPCMRCATPLIRIHGPEMDKSADSWECKPCREYSTAAQYNFAVHTDYLRHATRLNASDMLEQYRINVGTLQGWASKGYVAKRGRDDNGRRLYDVDQAVKMRDGKDEDDVA